MTVVTNTVLARNDANTIQVDTAYYDLNTKANQIVEDMVDFVEDIADDVESYVPVRINTLFDQGLGDTYYNKTEIDDTVGETRDLDRLLNEQVNALLSGTAHGSEREWEVAGVYPITPDSITVAPRDKGDCARILNTSESNVVTYGSILILDEKYTYFVSGDSGASYSCSSIVVGTAGLYYVDLHPKHGDIRSDFTSGNTYTVIVCREQTTGTLQTTSLPVTEHFLGTDINTVAEITAVVGATPVSGEIITLGVWQGKDFADMRPDGTQTVFQLSRKAINTPTSVLIDGVATTAFTFENVTNSLTMTSPVASTSYLTAVYTTRPRRLRPSIFPRNVKASTKQVTFHNRSDSGGEVSLCDLLSSPFIGGAQLSAGSSNAYASIPTELNTMAVTGTALFGINFGAIPDSAISKMARICPAIAFTVILNVVGNTYKISFLFKELIYDTDWGDDGKIPVMDNMVTTTDDNGNVVLCGCMSYDTGIEV